MRFFRLFSDTEYPKMTLQYPKIDVYAAFRLFFKFYINGLAIYIRMKRDGILRIRLFFKLSSFFILFLGSITIYCTTIIQPLYNHYTTIV